MERINKGKGASNIMHVGIGTGASLLLTLVFGWLSTTSSGDTDSLT